MLDHSIAEEVVQQLTEDNEIEFDENQFLAMKYYGIKSMKIDQKNGTILQEDQNEMI